MDKLLWSRLNDQSVNNIIEYLPLLERKNINNYWFHNTNEIINKTKFKIYGWYKYHKFVMENEINNDPFLENLSLIRLKNILIISYPIDSIIDMMYYFETIFYKNIQIYLGDYYIANYGEMVIDNDLEFDFTSIPNIKKIWKQFIDDCDENELRSLL